MATLVLAYKPGKYLKVVKQTYKGDLFGNASQEETGYFRRQASRWFLHRRIILHSHAAPRIKLNGEIELSYRDGFDAYDIALGCRGDNSETDHHLIEYSGDYKEALIAALTAYNQSKEPYIDFKPEDVFITIDESDSISDFQY